MAKTAKTTTKQPAATIPEPGEPVEVRIDAPHAVTKQGDAPAGSSAEAAANLAAVPVVETSAESVQAAAGETLHSREEQLHEQAADLAMHLQARLREIDQREAHLNARLAQFENETRAARIWQRERQMEFEEREAELRHHFADLQNRAAAVAAGEVNLESLAGLEQQMIEREKALQTLEAQLRERRQTLDREVETLRNTIPQQQQATEALEQSLREQFARREGELTARYERLETQLRADHEHRIAELAAAQIQTAGLAEQEDTLRRHYDELTARLLADTRERQAQLDSLREELDRQRTNLQHELELLDEQRHAFHIYQEQEREALLRRVELADTEIGQHRAEIAAREANLERERESLEQVRIEITASQRQTLEMRIITEQLWAQVTGRISSAEVTQSIAHLRLQLAEHYRLQQNSLGQQKETLLKLAERLKQQHHTIGQQRDELRTWAATQQAEIERQAKRLVAREMELDDQQRQFHVAEQSWAAERRQYEHRIRQLAAQFERVPAAA